MENYLNKVTAVLGPTKVFVDPRNCNLFPFDYHVDLQHRSRREKDCNFEDQQTLLLVPEQHNV